MIRRLIQRLFERKPRGAGAAATPAAAGSAAAPAAPAPRRPSGRARGKTGVRSALRTEARSYVASQEGIDRADVPSSAIRTCETLQQAGHRAYVVGGGVRDLLLGLKPKDFDVATDATPEQVTALFRRSRLIGRRFQIVHVMFGRETIEVSTFRAIQADAETDEHGRVLRDNVWGTLEEDAARRDFTVNALYYDPVADTILDYHDGVRDLKARVLRMIGDPATRYREDPVRMLRTARFAAKLGFEVEPATREPIRALADLLDHVPAARVFDEMLKLLQSGHAMQSLHQLRSEGLHHGLLPLLDVILEQPGGERFVNLALTRTDERVAQGKPISPGFLFATLLWHQINDRWQARVRAGEHNIPALMAAIDSVLDEQASRLAIQKRFISDMREIWSLQPRFDRRGRSAARLLEHIRFRAGYDFLMLRCESGEVPAELGEWWTRFIEGDHEARDALMSQQPAAGAKRRRRRKRPAGEGRRSQGEDDAREADGALPAGTEAGSAASRQPPADTGGDNAGREPQAAAPREQRDSPAAHGPGERS